jgi:BirA family biotin operon repressor/biotin-[acetyl-CoA-carboxylase] ligase
VGVGVNINEAAFDASLVNPVSLKQITGNSFDTVALAKELHQLIMKRIDEIITKSYESLLQNIIVICINYKTCQVKKGQHGF